MFERLIANWVYGGALAALLLLGLSPILLQHWPAALVATFLLLPAYMLHQYEEHDGDRFRAFFNRTLGKGLEVLSPLAVFVTNVPGVWGVIALSLYGAVALAPGMAMIAVYLVLLNALVHIVHSIIFRCYNPGLATAVSVFLPLGGVTLWLLQRSGAGALRYHVVGLVSAVLIHAAILVHVQARLAKLQGAAR